MITPVLPPSDTALPFTLGKPLGCVDVYLCSLEVDDVSSGDDEDSSNIDDPADE